MQEQSQLQKVIKPDLKPNSETIKFTSAALQAKALVANEEQIAKMVGDKEFAALANQFGAAADLLFIAALELHKLAKQKEENDEAVRHSKGS